MAGLGSFISLTHARLCQMNRDAQGEREAR
jgi:hypothetical protein